jgi:hypothetical protein
MFQQVLQAQLRHILDTEHHITSATLCSLPMCSLVIHQYMKTGAGTLQICNRIEILYWDIHLFPIMAVLHLFRIHHLGVITLIIPLGQIHPQHHLHQQ